MFFDIVWQRYLFSDVVTDAFSRVPGMERMVMRPTKFYGYPI